MVISDLKLESTSLVYIFIVAFLSCLMAGVLVPIYSDEAITKWPYANIFMRHAEVFSFLPQCNFSNSKRLQELFYPAALTVSFIYTKFGPIGIRIGGIAIALSFIYALWALVKEKFGNNDAALNLFATLLALLGLGVTPYLLIFARSEQLILLAIISLSLICLKKNRNNEFYLRVIGIYFFVSLCLLVHPKSIFWTPLFLYSVILITRGRSAFLRILLLTLLLSLVYYAYQNAAFTSACEAAPYANAILKSNTLSLDKLIISPLVFFQEGLRSIYDAPAKVLSQVLFQASYQSGWLAPQGEITPETVVANKIIYGVLFILLVGTHISILLEFLFRLGRRQLSEWNWLGLFIVVGSLSTAFFMKSWNFYSASLYIPLSVVLLIFISINSKEIFYTVARNSIMVGTVSLSSFSLWLLVSNESPLLFRATTSMSIEIPGQQLSIPALSASKHLENVRILASMCHIPKDGAKNLVVDHMTYYAFSELVTPIHALYVSEKVYGGDLSEGRLLSFLKQIRSPGVVARCEYVPPQLQQDIEHRYSGYCCLRIYN